MEIGYGVSLPGFDMSGVDKFRDDLMMKGT